jgi:hypothetical protein
VSSVPGLPVVRDNVCLNAAIHYLPTCEIDVELTAGLLFRWRVRDLDFELVRMGLANNAVGVLEKGAEVVAQSWVADVNVQSRWRAP